MAYYEFESDSGEIKTLEYKMSEAPPIGTEVKLEGIIYRRIYTSDFLFGRRTTVDPFSKDEYLKKTREQNLTYGDMVDLSGELAEKRKEKDGEDKVKNQYFDKYSADRGGTKCVGDTRKDVPKEPMKKSPKKVSKKS